MKTDFLKKLFALFKEAGVEAPVEVDKGMDDMQQACDKLATAIAAYGDGAGLAADHPLHALKALHKEMTEKMSKRLEDAKVAKAAREREEADAAAAAEGDTVTTAEVQEQVNKALVDVNKKLEAAEAVAKAAEKRATDAEAIAKSERDARNVEVEKTTLRKFKHVTVDVEKDAPTMAKLREADKPTYDFLISKMEASEAVAAKGAALEQELGSPLGGEPVSAWKEIEVEAAKEVAKGEKGLTIEKAIDKVMKARPDLVARYKSETSGRAAS